MVIAISYKHLGTKKMESEFGSWGKTEAGTPVIVENTQGQFFKILIKILAASSCMIDFFCKSMAASNFSNDRITTLNWIRNEN